MQVTRGLSYEPYTLVPLAHSLTALELRRSCSLFLVLSLMECQHMQQLKLDSISGAAGSPEVIVQVLRSMPLLRELELCRVTAPQLQQVSIWQRVNVCMFSVCVSVGVVMQHAWKSW